MRVDRVPVAPLREAYLRSGLRLSDVARAAGWMNPDGHADTSRVARRLGLVPWASRGTATVAQAVNYETAVVLVRALGHDPVDFGV